jgi:hypothetical protein
MAESQPNDASRRDKTFNLRMDVELYDAAMGKAEYGLGPAIRALLRAYVRGAVEIPPADLARELTSAPHIQRNPRRRTPVKGKPRKPAKE